MTDEALDAQRFRELFELAYDALFLATAEGRCSDANPAACRLLGYTREELIGRSVTELLDLDALPSSAAPTPLRSMGGPASERRLRRRDGGFVQVERGASPLATGGILAFARDIGERRAAMDRLRASEQMFAGIVTISADAIIAIDEAQHITMFNEGAEAIFGYRRDEILGAPLDRLLPERSRLVHRQHVATFAASDAASRRMGTRTSLIRAVRKDGAEFPADASISRLEIGGTRQLVVALRDISEQQRLEDEQRLLAELGRILIDAGPDYARLLTSIAEIIARDLADWCSIDVVEDGQVVRLRVIHADPSRAEACRGLERREVHRRRNLVTHVLETRQPLLVSDVTPEYLASLAEDPAHLELLRGMGPTSFIVVPLVARGQVLGTLAYGSSRPSRRFSARDLPLADRLASRIAMAVDNARLHQAMVRAVHARDEVLAIVAHDLRSPLHTITLLADAMRLVPGSPHEGPAARIHGAAIRMNALIQDLLDVARLEAGQALSVTCDAVPVEPVLAEAVERLRLASSRAEKQLTIDGPPAAAAIWGDRDRILQIFDNLIGNAIRFARAAITVRAAVEGAEVHLTVEDDGPGIAPADVPHVFDRYWQKPQPGHRGNGLGLWIVQAIVRAHGGRIWVDSTPGQGTAVHVALPCPPSPAPRARRTRKPRTPT
ncbi:MAG: PAS domain-containing sensor histidine kinase [Deltaproteobacteria bacterium]|nr:PAS domain-containing sensor histidine kinase [Deltaproteobacteria bacterium]